MFPQIQAIIAGIKTIKNFIFIGIGIVLLFMSYIHGERNIQVKWDTQKEKDAIVILQLRAKSAQVTTKIVTQYVDRIKTVTIKGNEIVKYIHVGITHHEDHKYKLPNNFVSLYNASVQNTIPSATTSSDAAPSTIKLSDALSIIASNNTQCLEYRQQVISLQDWITSQEIIYNGASAKYASDKIK